VRGRASQITDVGDGRILRRGGDPAREARVMEHARRHGYRRRTLPAHMRTLAELHQRLHRIEHPDGGTLLHHDLHSANVILGGDGPVVIDWTNSAAGEAALDPALVWVIFRTSGARAGPVAASLFACHFDRRELRRALPQALAYRLADPHVLPHERDRVERLKRRYP
jgi:aminoglycoside phosphotransferase (APT) family kinase protein